MPTARVFLGTGVVGNKIYAAGGVAEGLGPAILPAMEEFDSGTLHVEEKTSCQRCGDKSGEGIETVMVDEMTKKTYVSKKLMKDLFIAQCAKPLDLEEINLSQLTPFQRALLVTDGTVTRFIEAYTFSPVKLCCSTRRRKPCLPITFGLKPKKEQK